jgi:hypothetical protein
MICKSRSFYCRCFAGDGKRLSREWLHAAWRWGFNYSQTPMRQEIVFASIETPSTFQKHFCNGVSLKLMPNVTADAGIYIVPLEHVKGTSLDLNTEVPNSTYDMSNRFLLGHVAFNSHF